MILKAFAAANGNFHIFLSTLLVPFCNILVGSRRNRVVPSSPENKRHKKHARNIAHDKAELQDAGKKASAAPPPSPPLPSPTSWPPQLRVLPPRQKGSSHGTVHRENDAAASVSPERGHCGKCQKSQQHGERGRERDGK